MAHTVDPSRAGTAQGLLRASGLIAATIASALSGVVYADFGAIALFGGTALAVVVISIGGLLLLRGARASRRAKIAGLTDPSIQPSLNATDLIAPAMPR